jgi:hypothetical protein
VSEALVACPGVHTIIVHKDVLAVGEKHYEHWAVPQGTEILPLGQPRQIDGWVVSRVLVVPLGE